MDRVFFFEWIDLHDSLAGFVTKTEEELSDFRQRHQGNSDEKAQVAADFRQQLEGGLLPSNRLYRFVRGLEGQGDPGTTRCIIRTETFPIDDWKGVEPVVRRPIALGTVEVAIHVFRAVPKPSGS